MVLKKNGVNGKRVDHAACREPAGLARARQTCLHWQSGPKVPKKLANDVWQRVAAPTATRVLHISQAVP